MIRVVADTNIYLSALMFGGLPGIFLDLALARVFDLVVSGALLDELDEKLLMKFGMAPEEAAAIRVRLERSAQVVKPGATLSVIKDDPDDDRVLECAAEGRASIIVSGDRHLLSLGMYEAISILTVRHASSRFELRQARCA